jgi:CRISPR/Cas system-associated exonuclease Cas4 (RecB family)
MSIVKAWSFSTLQNFEKCPYRIYLKNVEKCPEPEMPPDNPLVRGDRIHKEAEDFVAGKGVITTDLKKFAPQLEALRTKYEEGRVEVEQKWGFTQSWEPCTWSDPNNYAYVKLDACVAESPTESTVVDYKTGKSWGKEVPHAQQLQIYTISTFMRSPSLNLVKAELWYLDEGKTKSMTYTRPQANDMLARWTPRIERLMTATSFPAKPNRSHCKYCPYGTKSGTAVCAYAVEE